MGNFNYPDINWETLQSGPNGKDFVKLVLDCYLQQHVCEPTRLNNILYLVFTSELNLTNDITTVWAKINCPLHLSQLHLPRLICK